MNPLHYGYVAVFIFVTAFSAVFVNIRFTEASSILITFSTFIFCWALFLGLDRHRLGHLVRLARQEKAGYFAINIATLLSWVGMFQALKLVAAPVQTVVYMSIIPAVTVFLSGEWREFPRWPLVAVLAIGILGMNVAYAHPTMTGPAMNDQLLGVFVALAAGSCGALYIVASSRLQKRNDLTTNDLIAARLPMLLVVTGAVCIPELISVFSLEFVAKALLLTATAVIIPVWTLQQSILKIGGVRTSVLIPLVPITALALEWREGVPVSVPALVSIGLQCAAIMWVSWVLARLRQAKPATPQPAAATAAEAQTARE
ncbi:MAG: hypothetical protein RID91_11055 [Azospirillaceae bacterium]